MLTSRATSSGFLKSLIPFLSLATLVLLFKAPTLTTPAYWDELGWTGQALWLKKHPLWAALPGLHPAATFWGHPPGLHFSLAILWKLFGPSMFLAHLLIALFAAVGICATMMLARQFYGLKTAIFAALFLFACPLYFAQSGMFLADVPVTAIGVLSIYLGLNKKYVPYLLCASFLVLMKETGAALPAALIVYRFLTDRPISKASFVEALRYSVPFFVIGSHAVVQKIVTGHYLAIYPFEFQLFGFTVSNVMHQMFLVTRWIFFEQGRFFFTILILLNFILNPHARKRPELLLFALILLFSGYSFSVIYLLPRYLLPVLPFFYMLAAVSLTDLIRSQSLQHGAAAAAICVMVWLFFVPSLQTNGEANLTYLNAIRVNRDVAKELTTTYQNARILSSFPSVTQFNHPVYGYVTKSLNVIRFHSESDLEKVNLILISKPRTQDLKELLSLAHKKEWILLKEFKSGTFETALYGPPAKPIGE